MLFLNFLENDRLSGDSNATGAMNVDIDFVEMIQQNGTCIENNFAIICIFFPRNS